MSDINSGPTVEEFREGLAALSNVELVARLNREVGNRGWGSSRGRFLFALDEELHHRDFDLSGVGGLHGIPGMRKFRLEANRLLYVESPVEH